MAFSSGCFQDLFVFSFHKLMMCPDVNLSLFCVGFAQFFESTDTKSLSVGTQRRVILITTGWGYYSSSTRLSLIPPLLAGVGVSHYCSPHGLH